MEGESMSEWKEVRLGDIVTVKSGYAYKGKYISNKGKNILLGMGCVSYNDKFLYSGARAYDEDCDERYCAKAGDIVFATRQQSDSLPILAMPAIIPDSLFDKKIIVGTNLYLIKNDSDIDNHFLFWLLKTPNYVNYISSVKTGTTVRMVTKKDVENYTFNCPSKEERDTISNILWGIDAKIETNNKLNEKLEEMAQAIFKSWFVDFEPFKDKPFHETELGMIPEGWEVGSLSDIATITMGQSPCGTSYNENGEGIIFYQGRTEFGFRFPSIRLYTTAPSRFAEVGSTLMSVRAPVGDINMALLRCCIGRGVASIKSNCDCDSYIYYLMKSLKKRFDIYNGEGTVFGSVGRDTLRGLLITIPPSSVISDFEMNISKIDSRIKTNELESQRLASLRDTLLPRLMSGELIV